MAAVMLLALMVPAPPAAGDVPPYEIGPSTPISGDGVTPRLWTDNPTCADIGYGFAFKLNGSPTGTFPLDGSNGGELMGGAPPDSANWVTVSNVSGGNSVFDWSSSLGIDAVIVKASNEANVYVYVPEDLGDTGLGSPANVTPIHAISHIDFCYDYEVDVSKTADPSFTRTWEWSISKSVDPATWDLFTGDTGTSLYTVSVVKTGYTDSDWAVAGSIVIDNLTPFDATLTGVTDIVSPATAAAVDCGVGFPYALPSGQTLTCSYGPVPLPDGSTRLNTATVTTSGIVGGGQATADVVFSDPTTEVNDEISVSDSYAGTLGFTSDDATWTYERTFACDADEGTHGNTATIDETGQSASASVDVDCYALVVTKDAQTSFRRTWTWIIDKSADQSFLLLSPGQIFQVNYQVDVSATSADSNWKVTGSIGVHNPAPIAAMLTGVTDVVSPDIAATVDCGVVFPYLLVPGATLLCSYSAYLPDAATRTNTATATLQNYDYDHETPMIPSGTTGFDGTATVDFAAAAVTYIDECVDVSDTNVGFLGTVCSSDAPATFNYALWFGNHPDADVYVDCGTTDHLNTASCVTNDTGTTASDDWTVTVQVACDFGCTLTPGYWKTHSVYGPAPYDDTWALLGEDTLFFLSGQSYHEVLWTNPKGGNAYYILAHAYIATKLNQFNGASIPPSVLAAFNEATALFATYTPEQIAGMKGKSGKVTRAKFIELATTLDDYNNGLTGPGHCSE